MLKSGFLSVKFHIIICPSKPPLAKSVKLFLFFAKDFTQSVGSFNEYKKGFENILSNFAAFNALTNSLAL